MVSSSSVNVTLCMAVRLYGTMAVWGHSRGRARVRILVRTTPDIHRAVAVAAAREGASMNEWAERVLAKAAGVG